LHITGTHINYYLVCKRKLWLFHHQVQMEQNSELVAMGKLIHESAYPYRNARYEEVEIGGIKVDFFDPKKKVVHEIKKTAAYEEAHEWQLKYYIMVLQQHGFGDVSGILEYPSQRQTKRVTLTEEDQRLLANIVFQTQVVAQQSFCPPINKTKGCKKCAYHDFCFVSEPLNA
jgi:CRISPR-associated exonuclease Cas4